MKHFLRIAGGVDVMPILMAIQRQPELWNTNELRTTHEQSPHQQVEDIWLWFNKWSDHPAETIDDLQTYPCEAWPKLPQIRPVVFDLMRKVEASQLGRCIITKLAPGKKIDPHVDMGAPATFYNRFQIALQNEPGSLFIIEDESVTFKAGEVWLINNKAEHSVINNSKKDRIVLIIDVRCA